MHFLITTIHNEKTRWDRINDHLNDVFTDEFIFPVLATDTRILSHTAIKTEKIKHQSLTMAYYTICQTAIFLKLEDFTILEDDLLIVKKDELHDLFVLMPEDFDLCYMTRTDHNNRSAKTKPYNEHWDTVVANWWETPITTWSNKFAHDFCAHIQNKLKDGIWLGHIDHELVQMVNTRRYKIYGAVTQTAIGLSNVKQVEMSKEGSITSDMVVTN